MKHLAIFFILVIPLTGLAQKRSKNQLQKEKQQSLERIKETERILGETAQQKKNTLGELAAVNQRIQQQEALIISIQSEIQLLDADIEENNDIIEALEEDLAQLKKEYATMVLTAQKASGKVDKLMFLFSAQTFDQLLMRLKYMEQYGKARQAQAEAITRVQNILGEQVRATDAIKKSKSQLLADEESEKNQLTTLKEKQSGIVKNLQKEEKKLKANLEETRRAVAQIDKLINDLIKEEIERAAREAREAKAAARVAEAKKIAEATVALSASFEDNKLKFAWPANGFVSQKFGRNKHPVLKGVEVPSEGVTIQTRQDEKVKSIFEGEVRMVAVVNLFGNSVIISHGEYFTVYAGLKEVYVKRGQRVATNQEIGQVTVNNEGVSELRFQIRRNTQALDPQQWLRK
jgi:septal ring factor EnvC (AmiA/AmiB activator)